MIIIDLVVADNIGVFGVAAGTLDKFASSTPTETRFTSLPVTEAESTSFHSLSPRSHSKCSSSSLERHAARHSANRDFLAQPNVPNPLSSSCLRHGCYQQSRSKQPQRGEDSAAIHEDEDWLVHGCQRSPKFETSKNRPNSLNLCGSWRSISGVDSGGKVSKEREGTNVVNRHSRKAREVCFALFDFMLALFQN